MRGPLVEILPLLHPSCSRVQSLGHPWLSFSPPLPSCARPVRPFVRASLAQPVLPFHLPRFFLPIGPGLVMHLNNLFISNSTLQATRPERKTFPRAAGTCRRIFVVAAAPVAIFRVSFFCFCSRVGCSDLTNRCPCQLRRLLLRYQNWLALHFSSLHARSFPGQKLMTDAWL